MLVDVVCLGGFDRKGYRMPTHAEVVFWLKGTVFDRFRGLPVEGWEGNDWEVGIFFIFRNDWR